MKTFLTLMLLTILLPAAGQQYFNMGYYNGIELEQGGQLEVRPDDIHPYHLFTGGYDTTGGVFSWRLRHALLSLDGTMVSSDTVYTHYNQVWPGLAEGTINTTDGGFAAIGGIRYDLVKMNSTGVMQWGFDLDSTLFMESVVELANGNFVTTGSRNDYHPNTVVSWFSAEGQLLDTAFYNFYPDLYENDMYREIFELPNGDLLLSGTVINQYFNENFDEILDYDPVMVRLSPTGELLWIEQYEGFYFEWQHWCILNDSGDTAICAAMVVDSIYEEGNWNSFYEAYWGNFAIKKIDLSDGSVIEEHVYEEEQFYHFYPMDFLKTPDNGYAILGNDAISYYSSSSYNAILMKVDSAFHFEWSQSYSPQPSDTINLYSEIIDFELAPDGGFIAAGWVLDSDAPVGEDFGDPDEGIIPSKMIPWVFKTDACGDLEWNNCGVGVQEQSLQNHLEVFPNPAHSQVSITGNQPFTEVHVFNAVGQLIKTFYFDNHNLSATIDVHDLPSGVYILRIADMGQPMYNTTLVVH